MTPKAPKALTAQRCVPCEGGMPSLRPEESLELHRQVPKWNLRHDRLRREYRFKDFVQALAFVDKVGVLAEKEGHHPDIHLTDYRNLAIELSTHAVGGLSTNDFVLAAKIDRLPGQN